MTTALVPPQGPSSRLGAWAVRHPWLFSIRLYVGAGVIFPLLVAVVVREHDSGLRQLDGQLLFALIGVLVITGLGWWKSAGLVASASQTSRASWLAVLPLISVLRLLPGGPRHDYADAAVVLASIAAGAFAEEVLARGAVLTAFEGHGRVRAAVVSGVWYGLLHLANILSTLAVAGVGLQVVRTTGMGILFGAIRLTSRDLWPLILAHFALDVVGWVYGFDLRVPLSPLDIVSDVGFGVVFAVTGIWILRSTPVAAAE